MKHRLATLGMTAALAFATPTLRAQTTGGATPPPNVLFISLDDLNTWIGCMDGHGQSLTPNFDRLARAGILFTNAHCADPQCNPSRTAIMTGRAPHDTGVYNNGQRMRDALPDETILPKYFGEHGYWAGGSGKILHYFIDARSWDTYFPPKEKENPFPAGYEPDHRPVSIKPAGPWMYTDTDWGAMPVDDKQFGGDYKVATWVGDQLGKKHDKPFFLACGIYHPHEPWFAPKKYFDLFPLDKIQLPPGYKPDDIDDLPPAGKKLAVGRYFPYIQSLGKWKEGIQGYLASIAFADAQLGRVLDALENGPNKDNTIVVLWSDHGWHLGEKEHWQKYTGWRVCTRVPLMFKVPAKLSAKLPAGVTPGGFCDAPVSLMSLFPTLTDLCGLPPKPSADSPSLVPLLADPQARWDHVAITDINSPGNYAVSAKDWRFIHYADGGEELYHLPSDPYEWNNLAAYPDYAGKIAELKARAPKTFAPEAKIPVDSLPLITFVKASGRPAEIPKVEGAAGRLAIRNASERMVTIFSVDAAGKETFVRRVGPAKVFETKGKPGSLWLVKTEDERISGYFVHIDRGAHVVIE